MVDVEQNTLSAFKQDSFAVPPSFVEVAPYWPGEGQDEAGDLSEVALEALAVDGWFANPARRASW